MIRFPTASIGVYLMALSTVVALPLLVFVIFLMMELESNQRDLLAADTAEDAQLVARAVDRSLQDMTTTLRILSTSPELEAGDFKAFHERTQNSLHSSLLYLLIADKDGQQIMNTRLPFGSPLGKMSNMESLETAQRTGAAHVSDVFFGATGGQFVFNVAMPLTGPSPQLDGATLVMTQNASDLARLLSTEGLPELWSAAVIDGSGKIITSSGASNASSISSFPEETMKLMTGINGTIEDVGGSPQQMYGYAQVLGSSWKAVVWGPIDTAQATLLTAWRQFVVGSLLFLGIGVLCAFLIARQLRAPIRRIAGMADRIGKGEIVSPVETRISEVNQIAIALSNASFDRSQAEDRTHLILHELVHRTKNILTLVQAMMRQLARQDTTMEEFQKAISNRLQGLGKSIEALASEQWAGVPLTHVVEIQLSTFAEAAERVDLQGEDFVLKAEAVQNLGLVLHELATNSVKYGALSVPQGRIRLRWEDRMADGKDAGEEEPEVLLCLSWEEIGGPLVSEPERSGFGTTIIKRHAASAFGGTVDVEFRESGLLWSLTAPRKAFERGAAETARDMLA